MTDTSKKLGLILRDERTRKGWTLDETINHLSIYPNIPIKKSALSLYENGARIPRADVLFALLDIYEYVNLDHIKQILLN